MDALIGCCRALAITVVCSTLLGFDRSVVDPTVHQLTPYAAKANLAWSELPLIDANGRPFRLKDFRGKVLVIDFFFSSCPGICPLQTAGLAKTWAKIPEWASNSIVFVSLTIDPQHDDAQHLSAYQQRFGIDSPSWIFATGSQANIASVSAYFGSLLPKRAPTEHKAQIYLMGPRGQLLMNYPSAPLDSERLSRELGEAVEAFIPETAPVPPVETLLIPGPDVNAANRP